MGVASNNIDNQINSFGVLDDEALSFWLEERLRSKSLVLYVHSRHQCKVCEISSAISSLIVASPGSKSIALMRRLAKLGKLQRLELEPTLFEDATQIDPAWTLLSSTPDDVSHWHKRRESLFGQGRGKPISKPTAARVWTAAGGRCMFRGCGTDLSHTPLTTKAAQIAYLAHIVGSDPEGPRGGPDSHALSDDHENIMLMCDAHHRLIDRIDCAGHPVERLQAMREEHTLRVNKLLDGLSYPRTQIITLLANLAQVPTNTSQSDLYESLLDLGLGPLPNTFHAIRRQQRDNRSHSGFWSNLLHEHELDIQNLTLHSNRSRALGGDPDLLALFPLHLVPILILAGRIIGEARPVEVFQYDRHRKSWVWAKAGHCSPPDSIVISKTFAVPTNEVLVSIELTASIDKNALPSHLATALENGSIPWIRIQHKSPNFNCISTRQDLEEFTKVARQVIQYVHDEVRATHVHLIGVSPASTLFRFGQLLQPGHHPTYEIYDRPDGANNFIPAIKITGAQVIASSPDTEPYAISLK